MTEKKNKFYYMGKFFNDFDVFKKFVENFRKDITTDESIEFLMRSLTEDVKINYRQMNKKINNAMFREITEKAFAIFIQELFTNNKND